MFAAVSNGSLAVVRAFLEDFGYEVDVRDKDAATPLLVAAWHGHAAVADYLVQRGADLSAECKNGWTAMLGAVRWGEAGMVRHLHARYGLSLEASIISQGRYAPVLLAAMYGQDAIIDYMLEVGISLLPVDPTGRNASTLARLNGFPTIADRIELYASNPLIQQQHYEHSEITRRKLPPTFLCQSGRRGKGNNIFVHTCSGGAIISVVTAA